MGKTWVSAVGLLGAAMVGAGPARADDRPLLVVVESPPGLGVDAAAVRQRVASELDRPVVSPRDPSAAAATDILVVALDGGQVQLSLREGSVTRVARAIPDLADRSARLRAIAWLAGNLARDQVSAIVPLLPATHAAALAGDRPVPAPGPEPERRDAVTEPPPLPPVPLPAAPAASVFKREEAAEAAPDRRWLVTVTGGRTATRVCFSATECAVPIMVYESSYALELQRQPTTGGLSIGGALDAGPVQHLLGALGFVGSRWQRRRWYLEATLGAGILAARIQALTTTVSNSTVTGTASETTLTTQVQPALYVRAVGSLGVPISDDLDLVARLGIHLTSNGRNTDFLSATAGVRLKLP